LFTLILFIHDKRLDDSKEPHRILGRRYIGLVINRIGRRLQRDFPSMLMGQKSDDVAVVFEIGEGDDGVVGCERSVEEGEDVLHKEVLCSQPFENKELVARFFKKRGMSGYWSSFILLKWR